MAQHCYKCGHELEYGPDGLYCMKCKGYVPKTTDGAYIATQCPAKLEDVDGKRVPLQCAKFSGHTGLHEAAGTRWAALVDFPGDGKAVKIDPTKPFSVRLDLSAYVRRAGNGYACTICGERLVTIEQHGLFGDGINQLDTTVILDHHVAKHPV